MAFFEGILPPDFPLCLVTFPDSLVGAVKWTPHGGIQDEYVASDLFFVRDHLGSVVMTLKAEKVCLEYGPPPMHIPTTVWSAATRRRFGLRIRETRGKSVPVPGFPRFPSPVSVPVSQKWKWRMIYAMAQGKIC